MTKKINNVNKCLHEISRDNVLSINGFVIDDLHYFMSDCFDGELYIEFTDVNDNYHYFKHTKSRPEITSVKIA